MYAHLFEPVPFFVMDDEVEEGVYEHHNRERNQDSNEHDAPVKIKTTTSDTIFISGSRNSKYRRLSQSDTELYRHENTYIAKTTKLIEGKHTGPEKHKTKYTFVKSLAKSVCLCKDEYGTVYVAKYGDIVSYSVRREIALTILLGTGTYSKRLWASIGKVRVTKPSLSRGVDQKMITPEEAPFIRETICDGSDNNSFTGARPRCGWLFKIWSLFKSYLCSCMCCCRPIPFKRDLQEDVNTHNQIKDDDVVVSEDTSNTKIKSDVYKISNIDHNLDLFSRVLSIDITPTRFYMVTQYVGCELYEFVTQRKRVSEEIAKKIFQQTVHALKNMHDLGIAHGDISLENICVEEIGDGEKNIKARLIDFGLSIIHPLSPYYDMVPDVNDNCSDTQKESNTKTLPYVVYGSDNNNRATSDLAECEYSRTMITKLKSPKEGFIYGKERYMSPERYRCHNDGNNTYCSYSDDFYSLGVVLFTILAGQMPYFSPNLMDTRFADVINGSWMLNKNLYGLDDVSDDVIDLLSKLICYQEHRLDVKGILNHPWFQGGSLKI